MTITRRSIIADWSVVLPMWLIVGICCALPLGWMALQVLLHPGVLAQAISIPEFRGQLLARTLLYNGLAAALAVLMSLPAALVIGRGRGWPARLLLVALPVAMLFPSVTFTYGWSQFFWLIGAQMVPAGPADVLRCIWTLASWLWALPAVGIGLSLRYLDTHLQQQALMDGALWRLTLRSLIGPIVASFAACAVLAVQEFAVYEPTGISVVATEVRTVFETGLAGRDAPFLASVSSAGAGRGSDQHQRAAAAIATAIPLLLVVAGLCVLAMWGVRRLSGTERVDVGAWPRSLDAPNAAIIGAMLLTAVNLLLPLAGLVFSLRRPPDPLRILETFWPQILGSLCIGALTGILLLILAMLACARRSAAAIVLAVTSFLIGGQLLAIAQIRIYNQRNILFDWIYCGPAVVVLTHAARFAWLALLAGELSWGRSFREIREMAEIDGAAPLRTTARIIWPLVWPIIVGAGVLTMILSMTEVAATVLLQPLNPPVLIGMLMTWIHILRSDDMIEGSLLLTTISVILGLCVVALAAAAMRIARSRPRRLSTTIVLLGLILPGGCGRSDEPEEVWGETGVGPGQFVYPRAIAYSPAADEFFVVDRTAHVQRLDRNGRCISEWRMPEWNNGKPVGLSVGPDGNLYVPDTHYSRVIVYTPDGKELRRWGSEGKGPGQFIWPTDVAFDRDGNIYVSEYGDNDRIQVFDPQGNYLRQFGKTGNGPGEFSRPQSILIDGDLVYVADASNHRIVVFKTNGSYVRQLGKLGSAPGELRYPYGLAEDKQGHLVICEFGNNRVQFIDKQTGKASSSWGTGGREPGQLAYPWAVAVDKSNRVIVVDSGNNRLQVIK